jgi:transcriptional regulator with XRE-family HTH domain
MQTFKDKDFFAAILQKRIKDNLTLQKSAKQMRLPFSTVQRIEAGRLPNIPAYVRICAWLGHPISRYFETLNPTTGKQSSKSKTVKK